MKEENPSSNDGYVRPMTGDLPSLEEIQKATGMDGSIPDEDIDAQIAKSPFATVTTPLLETALATNSFAEAAPLMRKGLLRLLRKRWVEQSTSARSNVLDALSTQYTWGSFGKSGKEPIKVRKLYELETDHIENILFYCVAPEAHRYVLVYILRGRTQEEALKRLNP